jgi:hypothetical protein
MTFEGLDDSGFEELTYELFVSLGFKNVNWRRGSGQGGATADQGRDIVADEVRNGIDGTTHFEKWFVQCKHYVKGVPPEKLQGALSWANSQRPHVLLFVVSNFLSNSAKNYLDDYAKNNTPPYRLKIWERKDLERILASYPILTRKYNLVPSEPWASVHPAHAQYLLNTSFNSLDFFFEQLDAMDKTIRDNFFYWAYSAIIMPRFREPKHSSETLGELMMDRVDYANFKVKCRLVASSRVEEDFIVHGCVAAALRWAWHMGNPSKVDQTIANAKETLSNIVRSEAEQNTIQHSNLKTMLEEVIQNAAVRQQESQRHYIYLCEVFLPSLATEADSGSELIITSTVPH